MTTNIGSTVLYTLTESDAQQITHNRDNYGTAKARGNDVAAGDTYPARVVRTSEDTTAPVNLQVLLDGSDIYWATARSLYDPEHHTDPRGHYQPAPGASE